MAGWTTPPKARDVNHSLVISILTHRFRLDPVPGFHHVSVQIRTISNGFLLVMSLCISDQISHRGFILKPSQPTDVTVPQVDENDRSNNS